MDHEPRQPGLTQGELQYLDGLITMLQEQGLRLDDDVKAQSDVCCCGAVTAETKGKFVFNEHDRELVRQIAELEQQIESSPTLGQLIEMRGELLRERMG
jgi:hypothetical protein